MDNKKETERAELHRTIWGIANDLRGGNRSEVKKNVVTRLQEFFEKYFGV